MSISVEEHQAAVRQLLGTAAVRSMPVGDCHGLVLAEEIPAEVSLPPFDNAAMDGYAVRAADVSGASEQHPVHLAVREDIPAGRTSIPRLDPHTAHRIMTGAPIPHGADAVVRVEDTQTQAGAGLGTARIYTGVEQGKHIRTAGEDITRGSPALRSPTVLGAAQLGLASAIGRSTLAVRVPPTVLVVSTGTELVTPPSPLRDGQIYESNSVMLASALRELGCRVTVLRSVPDDTESFTRTLRRHMAGVDLVVTSGGVSEGAYEVVKDTLTDQGVTFTKVAMQPGGPQGYGTFEGVPVVALPGNPVSVLVSYEVFLRPALLAALGHTQLDRPGRRARLAEPLQAPAGRKQYRRGHFQPPDETSRNSVAGTAHPTGGAGSHLLAAFTRANCLIVIDEATTELAEGAEVDLLMLS